MPPKALLIYAEEALKRRAEEQLYQAYTTTLLQLIMQHKTSENMPLYIEKVKEIYDIGKPKPKKKTASEIIAETRGKVRNESI